MKADPIRLIPWKLTENGKFLVDVEDIEGTRI